MKKLTVTVVLMLALNLSMAASVSEEIALFERMLNNASTKSNASAEAISGTRVRHLKAALKADSEVEDKEIPSFHHRNDGLGLFAKNDAAALNQIMTNSPLYALLSMLKANGDLSGLAHAGEYVLLLNTLTEINHRLDALLTEAVAGNERLLALIERLAKES